MLSTRTCQLVLKRFKHGRTHWSVLQKKKYPKDRALKSFDDFYGSVFGNRWKSIRVALLCEHKYIALVNNFGDTENTIAELEAEGGINVRSIYNVAKDTLANDNLGVFGAQKVFKLDDKLEAILSKQEQQELQSVYPEGVDSSPERLSTAKPENIESTPLDYKKSLTQTIEEDSHLDERRLVDSAYGTAALHEFIPATKLKGMEDWVLESDHYKYYKIAADFPISMEIETDFEIPATLNMFTFEKGNVSRFPKPKKSMTGVLSHFLCDGASILPPLALNIQPGDRVLDACAAPGGKSLIMLQTLRSDMLVCNDQQQSRVNRIKKLMREYVLDFDNKWREKRCLITHEDARNIEEYQQYDKILIDVPCTTDRHSLIENDNNIFKPTRVKERLRIPEMQSAILANCIRLLKPGGSLVYSTCSLSPVQNDGVVHMALSKVFEEFRITATVKDLSMAMQPFSDIFKFENPRGLKYGQMVLPYLPANFGPMYFSKIVRTSS